MLKQELGSNPLPVAYVTLGQGRASMSSLSCEKGAVSAALGEKKDDNENRTKDPRTQ